MRYGVKWPQYAKQWDRMVIKAYRQAEFHSLALHILHNKVRYQVIETSTGVPWTLIAVLHMRESNADFSTYLGNGEPLKRKTRLVPRGRGPFATFEAGAIDALKLDGLTDVKDWRLEKELYYTEVFNGGGYDARGGLPSPYVWGGTSEQRAGKYVGDGRFDPRAWDMQPGTAPILKTLADLDPTIQFVRES
jgi:lysozyme family protein